MAIMFGMLALFFAGIILILFITNKNSAHGT